MNIVANAAGTQPAAVEWTLSYPAADVAGISVALGSAASSAGKTIACAPNGSAINCIVYGLNETPIPNGPVAVATVSLATAPPDSNIPLMISGLAASDADGNAIADTGSNAAISVLPSIPQTGLICSSTSVQTPGTVACTISVSESSASASGFTVGLGSNNSALQVPATVSIPAGVSTANFTASALSIPAAESATLTATGGSNTPSVSLSLLPVVVATLPPPSVCTSNCPIALDAGGSATGSFSADADYSGGSTYANSGLSIDTSAVTNPAPQSLYQSERFGNFTYTIPKLKPLTQYTVRLHFAEIYWTQPGQRVFNASINGSAVLKQFDIVAAAGATHKAIVEQFKATANLLGQIKVQFTSVVDNATLSGIEVIPVTAPSSTPAIAVSVDAGGGSSGTFAADVDYAGGSTYSSGLTIDTTGVTNPAPQAVYQSQRFGNFTYTIPKLTPGTMYTVRLHFAEIYWTQTGQRVFNVAINGTPVLTAFDIVAAAGAPCKALVEQFTATADASGQITVQFASLVDNANLSGIEVF